MLRDIIRLVSDGNRYGPGMEVSVVDERSELAACFKGVPQCDLGRRTDVLDGCPKAVGMVMMIRSMAPGVVAVDEIGTREDMEALRNVMKCGCKILATVHGNSVEDLRQKPVLSEMAAEGMFSRYVVLKRVPRPGTVAGIYDGRLAKIESVRGGRPDGMEDARGGQRAEEESICGGRHNEMESACGGRPDGTEYARSGQQPARREDGGMAK